MTCSGFLYNLIYITMETAMRSITHDRLRVNAECAFTSPPEWPIYSIVGVYSHLSLTSGDALGVPIP